MLDAGELTIDLREGVALTSTRPAALGRAFIGKTPAQALDVVPLLFAVCGKAQAEACRRALGDAPSHAGAEVVAEALREHFMRIAIDWTAALGQAPDPMVLRPIHGLVAQAARDAGAAATAADAISAQMIGAALQGGADTIAARLLQRVGDKGWSEAGAVPALHPAETTAYTLMMHDSRVRSAGNGLLGRLTARLVHVEALIRQLRGEASPEASGVITSRGLLHHRARLEGGVIAEYAVVAPADVNFGPDGPLARSLAARSVWQEAAARLVVEAFDPCIACHVRVSG